MDKLTPSPMREQPTRSPSKSDINSAYLGTNLESKVTINARGTGMTVPASGTYRIEAWGASGGNSGSNGNGNGGHGAKVNGNFTLQKNSILRLIIGQQGYGSLRSRWRWRHLHF